MPKRRKDKDPVPVMPQRYTWKRASSFTTFEKAKEYKDAFSTEGFLLKIKRRKNSFDVRVGTPIKKD